MRFQVFLQYRTDSSAWGSESHDEITGPSSCRTFPEWRFEEGT
jgi:hypothetical protein